MKKNFKTLPNYRITKLTNYYLGLSTVVFQLSCSTGFSLQIRRKAHAQIFTGFFTAIQQPVNFINFIQQIFGKAKIST
jgi:hypothetical protein